MKPSAEIHQFTSPLEPADFITRFAPQATHVLARFNYVPTSQGEFYLSYEERGLRRSRAVTFLAEPYPGSPGTLITARFRDNAVANAVRKIDVWSG